MPKQKSNRVTLTDVAREAGVSLSTASKVLNGRADVADATRATIEQALQDLGYVSRVDKRAYQARRTVLTVLANGVNAYAAEVLEGIMAEAASRGVEIVVTRAAAADQINPAQLVHDILADGHLGVVLVCPDFRDEDAAFFTRRRVPMAMVDPMDPVHDKGVSIGSSNWSGGFTITRYLLDQGHTRIGFAGGAKRSLVNQARL
ncbi:MAG: LacI family transcriptional regulator, partial [Propionibacteriaceae bacterium]|nr:LacI family transcriptional regulator [Propionibacteriaceae bacterium]